MSKAYSKAALLENRIVFLRWSIAALLALALAVAAASFLEANLFARQPALLLAAPVSLILVGGMFILHRTKARLQTYRSAEQNIAKSLRASSSKIIHDLKRQMREAAARDPIIEGLLSDNISAIEQRLQAVLDAEVLDQRRQAVSARCAKARKLLLDRLEAKRVASPAIRAEQAIVEAIHQLKKLKAKAVEQLDAQRALVAHLVV